MNTITDEQVRAVSHRLKVSESNANLIVFIGPPKTGTTSIIASLGARQNKNMLGSKNIFLQEIDKAQITYNDLAKVLCHDPSRLNLHPVTRQSTTSIIAAEAFWGCIKDQSLFAFLQHCEQSFASIEVVFIKRDFEDLALSQFLQSCKVLLREDSAKGFSRYSASQRSEFIENKITNFLCGHGSILRPYGDNFTVLAKCPFPVSFIEFDKSRDIVSEFFQRILGCELQDRSMTEMNRTSSAEDLIISYLCEKIISLLNNSEIALSDARRKLLRDNLETLPSNLKLSIRRLAGKKFRERAAQMENQFKDVMPMFQKK